MNDLATDTRSLVVELNRQLNWSQEDRHQDADPREGGTLLRVEESGFQSPDEAGYRIMGAGWSRLRAASNKARAPRSGSRGPIK